jgi:hypothetical protein
LDAPQDHLLVPGRTFRLPPARLGQPASLTEISQSPQVLVIVTRVAPTGTVTMPLPRLRVRPSSSCAPTTGSPPRAWIDQSTRQPDRVVELMSQAILTFDDVNDTDDQS